MRGFGLYISIVTRIYCTKCRHLTLTQCMHIKEKGCAMGIVKRVIHNYGLFRIDSYNHVSSSIDFLGGNDTEVDTNNNTTLDATLDFPTPAPAYYKNKKENKKNDYHHSKIYDDDEPLPPVLMDPIQYLRSLPLHTAWAEALLQSLGLTNPILRQLVMSQWEETKAFLALHVASQDKAALLLSEHDVKRYFTNCLNNPTTARKLQEHLAAQRAKEQEAQMEEMQRLMEQESHQTYK